MVILIFAVLFCISTVGTVSAADTQNPGPTVTTNLTGGTYNTTQTVAFTSKMIVVQQSTTPQDGTKSKNKVAQESLIPSPITIDTTTTLRYAAVEYCRELESSYI